MRTLGRIVQPVATSVALAALAAGCSELALAGHAGSSPPRLVRREQERVLGVPQRVLLADFDRSGHQTNAGEPFGAWEGDPGDRTQSCRARLVSEERVGADGFGLMLEYDVESPNPAFNGFWMKLPRLAVREFDTLSFDIKGDAQHGFTRRLWIELKSPSRSARFRLDGIEPRWQRVQIPLDAFEGIARLRELTEFVVVFDDHTVTEPVGAIYLDNVALESGV